MTKGMLMTLCVYAVSLILMAIKLKEIKHSYNREEWVLYFYSMFTPILNTLFALAIIADFVMIIFTKVAYFYNTLKRKIRK